MDVGHGVCTCLYVLAGSDALDDCTCKAGYTVSNGGACTACEAGKYKEVSGAGGAAGAARIIVTPLRSFENGLLTVVRV